MDEKHSVEQLGQNRLGWDIFGSPGQHRKLVAALNSTCPNTRYHGA
jgi:hypothetical protein